MMMQRASLRQSLEQQQHDDDDDDGGCRGSGSGGSIEHFTMKLIQLPNGADIHDPVAIYMQNKVN